LDLVGSKAVALGFEGRRAVVLRAAVASTRSRGGSVVPAGSGLVVGAPGRALVDMEAVGIEVTDGPGVGSA
jgi:hypothetical protein